MAPSLIKAVVVDDDSDVQFLYKHKLERDGFKVFVAGTGEEGLAIIERHRPDIVLLDLLMPGMSGPDMLARLRSTEWGSEIRVIVLTNISKDEAPPALRFLNVDRYVVKAHHTPAQIADIVHEVLGHKPT
jgi:DNA-binding response OmpR family regulator